jgi:4-hydroxybenzoate polyprenyltransferase
MTMQAWYVKAQPYIQLMRLDKPIGILLLLWPTLSALWIAGDGSPDIGLVIIFTLGVIVMRSAGCVINDYADRNYDGQVARTKQRPLAAGILNKNQALICFFSLCVFAFFLAIFLNWTTILMSVVALFLAATYPFMKRFTYLPQVYLGAAFGWAIPMTFTAQTGSISAIAWLLFLANILWTTAYDTYYAMADRDDDLKAGIKSTAILFGDDDKLIIGILQMSFIAVLVLVGMQLEMGAYYYIALLIAMLLFVYQQQLTILKEPARCLLAFFNNNWVGAIVFIGIVLDYSFR